MAESVSCSMRASSASSAVAKSGGTSSAAKCCCTKCRQNASTVPMAARCNKSCWRRSRISPGWARTSSARRVVISARSLAAAALVKVMMSRLSASTGLTGSVISPTTRSTSTRVLPEPAAADTSKLPPRAVMAADWAGVNCILADSGISQIPHSLDGSGASNGSSGTAGVRSCSPSRWRQAMRNSQ